MQHPLSGVLIERGFKGFRIKVVFVKAVQFIQLLEYSAI